MDSEEARAVFTAERHAVLGTVTPAGAPHLVPVTFVVINDCVYIAVDHKPKRSTDLQRLRNIAAHPAVCLLAESYADDWSRLWWVRGDGTARVAEFAELPTGLLPRFQAKYAPYVAAPPAGPVIEVAVSRWSGWRMVTGSSQRPTSSS